MEIYFLKTTPKKFKRLRLGHLLPLGVALGGCGREEDAETRIKGKYISNGEYNLYDFTDDDILDSTSQGSFWDTDRGDIIRFSTSNGFSGEKWSDQFHVAGLLETAMKNLEYYTDVKIEYIGHFSDPEVASDAGSIINLTLDSGGKYVPYYASAAAFFPNDPNPQSAGDIFFTSGLNDSLSSANLGDQYFFILLHEMGHSLGLKHPHDDGGNGGPTFDQVNLNRFDYDLFTVMSYNDQLEDYNFKYDPASFMLFDVYKLQSLYGANTSTNSGDNRFLLKDETHYTTIYDAAGNDTIDMSNFSAGATAVLGDWSPSDGTYLKAGYIASWRLDIQDPTTLIWLLGEYENVIGTNFGDEIWNQSHDNVIKAGAGDDIIYLWKGGADNVYGGTGQDDYYVFQTDGHAVINDFVPGEDSFVIIDEGGDFVSSEKYSSNISADGDLVINLTDIGRLEITGVNERLAYSITENDSKDFVYFEKYQDLFELHIDSFSYFDSAVEEILNGTSSQKFTITFEDIETENPNYQGKQYADFNWIDAESLWVSERNGKKTIIGRHDLMSEINLKANYDYIGIYIATDNLWVGEDFPLADVVMLA